MASTKSAYRVGWLIDGTGQPAVDERMIIVDGRRIRRIGAADEPLPEDVAIVDLSDCTVFPALIDCHVHLVMSGSTEPSFSRNQLSGVYPERRKIIGDHLQQHWACGVLAVRDGGDHNGDVLRHKWDPTNQLLPGFTFAAPGRARHSLGRYGNLIGIPPDTGMTLYESAFGNHSRRDHLKLVNSGLNSLTQFGMETAPQFDATELADTVAAAHARSIPVMVHANGHLPVKLAVEASCDSIEHGFFMGRENMHRMADKGVVWVPTAVTMKAYSDYLINQGHRRDPSFADVSRKNLEHQLEQIGIAKQLGVTLALGTDAGSPGVYHGRSVKEELALFVAAGFSVEGAIKCASRNGARLMGMADRGRITAGMRADFMAVKAPVEAVPKALGRIVYRVVEGRLIDVKDLNS